MNENENFKDLKQFFDETPGALWRANYLVSDALNNVQNNEYLGHNFELEDTLKFILTVDYTEEEMERNLKDKSLEELAKEIIDEENLNKFLKEEHSKMIKKLMEKNEIFKEHIEDLRPHEKKRMNNLIGEEKENYTNVIYYICEDIIENEEYTSKEEKEFDEYFELIKPLFEKYEKEGLETIYLDIIYLYLTNQIEKISENKIEKWKDIENGIIKVKKEEEEEFEEFLNEEKKKVLEKEINWEKEEGNLEERKEFYKVVIKEELEKYEKEEKLKEEIEKMKETEIEEIEKDEKKIVKEVEEEDPTINERKEKLSNLLNTIIDGTSNENTDNIEGILELLKENFINKWVKENNKKKIYLISTNTKQFFDKNEEIIETIILTMDLGKEEFFGNIPKCIFKFSEDLCRNDNSLFCLFCKVNV
uniref:Uncharacterized protein n=1 Tax=Meloidogyne javanica TaxID=6303 RepID=A0A915M9A1_MELJA